MSIAAYVLAVVVGIYIGVLRSREKNLKRQIELLKKEDSSWHEGFQTGWKHASEDFTNVRQAWERMTRSDS